MRKPSLRPIPTPNIRDMRGRVSGVRSFVILTEAFALESGRHLASTFRQTKKGLY
jgi:hypothetical protein